MTDKELNHKISAAVTRLRINNGYSSALKFAHEVGFCSSHYQRVESGQGITLKTLNKILNAHNLTFKEFAEQELK